MHISNRMQHTTLRATSSLSAPSLTRTDLARFSIPARMLIATIRLAGTETAMPPLERCVLDTIGRILDSGDQRERTIDAVNRFSVFALTRTRLPITMNTNTLSTLTNDELILLKGASQIANNNFKEAHDSLQWLMETKVRNQFICALKTLSSAKCFKTLGTHAFTANSFTASIDGKYVSQHHCTILKCDDLSLSELLIVNAIRLWVRGISIGFSSEGAIHSLANHLGLADFADPLHNLLLETAYKATRQVDIRCLCCLELSPDEARILATLSSLQHGRPAAAVTHLEQWFADVSIQRVLTYSAQMRHSLKSLDNPLPLRQWDFEGMLQRQVLFEHGRTGTHLVSVH
ncbi:MAG: hypothetical protein ACJAZF_002835 [Granulosicoccus sp.]|jgi:hypothetical protein